MPWPHTHPSVNCYRAHKCRCRGCKDENALAKARYRAGKLVPKREPKRQNPPMDDAELHRLRRLVGLE